MRDGFVMLWFCGILAASFLANTLAVAQPADTGAETVTLTLDDALEMAATQNPSAAAAEARIDKAKGEYRQTRLWPNPQLEIGMEGITPDGERSSGGREARKTLQAVRNRAFEEAGIPADILWPKQGAAERPDQRQTLVSMRQTLPLAGGRQRLQQAARQEILYQEQMREVVRLDLRTEVKKAFLEVLFAQQALETLREMEEQLRQIVTITKARFDSGDIAESELLRAEANHSRFLLDVTAAQENLDTALIALAQVVGRPELRIGECKGGVEVAPPQIAWPEMERQLKETPRAQALDMRKEKAGLDLKAERAKRFPSPVLGVGYRHYQSTDQDTLDVSLGIEVPLFDRRQGHIAAAQANLREAEAIRQQESNSLVKAMLIIRKRHEYLIRELEEFKISILPKMTECLTVSQSAFDAGGNSMIEVLDAYRALAETRLCFLETNKNHSGLLIDLEALTNQEWFKP